MKPKVLILTTTDPGNSFPENFSCWCAGALEAKGYATALETVNLETIVTSSSSEPLKIQAEKIVDLEETLSIIEKLVLILPEHNDMIPVGLDNFMKLLATNMHKNNYTLCQLIAIVMDPIDAEGENEAYVRQKDFLFRYPLHKLDTFFGPNFSQSRIQISSSPTGNMCPLFAEYYNDLCELVEQIIA